MPFIGTDLVVVPRGDRAWTVLRPLTYEGGLGDRFTIPAGYVTDFATVPRVAVWLIPTFGRYTRSAILHDYLITDAIPAGMVSSVDADGIFRRTMRELGVPPVKRWLMWAAVRLAAAFSAKRRPGWWSTAPAVLGIALLALPLAVPMAGVAAGLVVYAIAEFIATGGRSSTTLST